MLARTFRALIFSPLYGLLLSLVIIPLSLLIGLILVMTASISPWMALGALSLSFILSTAIYAQAARYAGSWTGLQPLAQQPTYFYAVKRCLVVTVLISIFSVLFGIAFFAVAKALGGAGVWWWMDTEMLAFAIEAVTQSPDRAEDFFSYENLNVGSLMLVITLFSMFFTTVFALFAIPRAVGLGPGYSAAYEIGQILARVFIAFPILALISGLLSTLIVRLFESAVDASAWNALQSASLAFFFESSFFVGMIFVFEAFLLRYSYQPKSEQLSWETVGPEVGAEDFRAMRESWNERR